MLGLSDTSACCSTDDADSTTAAESADTAMKFLNNAPRFLFYTGKGGVGKTLHRLRERDDPRSRRQESAAREHRSASNVGQVFGVSIGNTITPIPAAPGLSALEIDPEQAAAAYRERIIGPVRGLLPEKEIVAIAEQLSGSCTTEIASFNEFTGLLSGRDDITADFDHVSSIPPRPGTPSGSCSFPDRGPSSSTTVKAMHRASGRCPGSTSSAPSTPTPLPRSQIRSGPASSWSRAPSVRRSPKSPAPTANSPTSDWPPTRRHQRRPP